MRTALLILATVVLALTASWLIWRDELTPPGLAPPPSAAPTALQRRFGWNLSPGIAAALDRPLPATFTCDGGFEQTIERMREPAGVEIFVNWRNVTDVGGVEPDTPVNAAVAGKPLREALPAVLASLPVHEPLDVEADDNVLVIDVASRTGLNTITRVYDVRDLLPMNGPPIAITAAADGLAADIRQFIAPGTWRTPDVRDGRPRPGAIRHLSGQLIVTHTHVAQYDLVQYLNRLRLARARQRFALRAMALTSGCLATVLLAVLTRRLLDHRRMRRAGLCRTCGYDLRASEGRCPECGSTFEAAPAPTPP